MTMMSQLHHNDDFVVREVGNQLFRKNGVPHEEIFESEIVFMPYHTSAMKQFLATISERLERAIYTPIGVLQAHAWVTLEPVPFTERIQGQGQSIKIGESWGKLWDCAWFHFTGAVPQEAAGQNIVLLIDLGGEGCVFDTEGSPVLGLTTIPSNLNRKLGTPGKRVVPWLSVAQGGEDIDLWVEAGCNDLFGAKQNLGMLTEAHVAICNEEMRQLFYDFTVLGELMTLLPETSARHQRILAALYQAARELCSYSAEEARRARQALAGELAKVGGTPSLRISAIGHAHIDLAWLWPIRETIRKVGRTFATVLALMERYPEYVFGQSQPQMYQWTKERYPSLYQRVKAQVARGRWEPQGAMWVESDTSLPSGESLVRQLLYGKRFFRQEFGRDVKIAWLPDTFGYSAALPQILKKAGVEYFVTIKMSWNTVNKIPHHTFFWQGIDGSQVLVHMPPEGDYNSSGSPRALQAIEQKFADKVVSEHALLLYGIGDGGGGPGEEHLECLRREVDLNGLPPVTQEPAERFFERLAPEVQRYQTWVGELYLERHQGTLTTQGRNKRYNRRMELALRELEMVAIFAQSASGGAYLYPAAALEQIWKEVLLYQFHDILPGSSITRVYDESLARYQVLLEQVEELTAAAYRAFLATIDVGERREGAIVVNPLSWERTEWLQLDGDWVRVTVPPLGYTTIERHCVEPVPSTCTATPEQLENDLLRVRFGADGAITSIYDKTWQREVLATGGRGNVLTVYHDSGDAWDIPSNYADLPHQICTLVETSAEMDGPRASVVQRYRIGGSTIEQRISLTAGSPRLDFATRVDWLESQRMLRTRFPLAIRAREATCEIQFGSLKRSTHTNTSWDHARFEVCAQKWIDLSQEDYGVALLNNGKYGHAISENTLDLNLLRSPIHPDPQADRGQHEFTYALYPHARNQPTSRVMQAAYELNVPLHVLPRPDKNEPGTGTLPSHYSFMEVDAENVIIETIKKAEDDTQMVVRLYEGLGAETMATLRFAFPFTTIQLVNVLEETLEELSPRGECVELTFRPFEIHTLKISLA